MQKRLRRALVAGEGERNVEMQTRAAPSTVNWRIPAKLHPAEEASLNEGRARVGRDRILPSRLQCPRCQSTNTNLDRRVFGHTTLQRHSCNDCGIWSDWKNCVSPNQLPGADCREKGISIQEVDGNLPFKTEHRSPPPSNPSAEGKEECLGERSPSFQGKWDASGFPLHEQFPDRRKSDIPFPPPRRLYPGECSKTPSSPSAMPPTSSDELDDDHPLSSPEGSLLHSAYLVLLAHKNVVIEDLVDYFEREPSTTGKFPNYWQEQLENLLMSNRYFLQLKPGLFSTSPDLAQPPPTRLAAKDLSVVIGGRDRNLGESSHERTPHLSLAVPTSSRFTRLEHPDWTPSTDIEEPRGSGRKGAPQGGEGGPLQKLRALLEQRIGEGAPQGEEGGPLQKLRALLEQRIGEASRPEKQCAWKIRGLRCPLNALVGKQYCDHHKKV